MHIGVSKNDRSMIKKTYICFLLLLFLLCKSEVSENKNEPNEEREKTELLKNYKQHIQIAKDLLTLTLKLTHIIFFEELLSPPGPKFSKYGIEFNEEREKIGLPILNDNFKHRFTITKKSRSHFDKNDSMPGILTTSEWEGRPRPSHVFKRTVYNDDTIIWETNCYSGMKTFFTFHVDADEESLCIRYDFRDGQWSINFRTGIMRDNQTSNIKLTQKFYSMEYLKLTKIEADSLLNLWGLQFP